MRLSGLSPEAQQRIAVLVPLVALSLSLFVVWPKWGSYRALEVEVDKLQQERDALAAAPVPKPGPIAPAAPALPTEPPQFLSVVRRLATLSQCSITGFDLAAQTANDSAAVRAVRARIEVTAPYPRVREFLIRLASAPRLLVVAELDVTPEMANSDPTGNVIARLQLERYVTPSDDTLKKEAAPAADTAVEATPNSGL